jgi:hypothetical protein
MTMSDTQQRELEQRIADDSEHAMARVAELEAQLAALQHAACPHCGRTLTGQKLAPFGHDGSEETATGEWRPVTEKPVADDVAGCVPATATPVVWEAGRQ